MEQRSAPIVTIWMRPGALLVTYPDGTKERIFSGEVSVRGLYGYLPEAEL